MSPNDDTSGDGDVDGDGDGDGVVPSSSSSSSSSSWRKNGRGRRRRKAANTTASGTGRAGRKRRRIRRSEPTVEDDDDDEDEEKIADDDDDDDDADENAGKTKSDRNKEIVRSSSSSSSSKGNHPNPADGIGRRGRNAARDNGQDDDDDDDDDDDAEAEMETETERAATAEEDRATTTKKTKNDDGSTTATTSSSSSSAKTKSSGGGDQSDGSLPRTRETEILRGDRGRGTAHRYVMGIDEAGRGPLAGPVVAAAVIVPSFVGGIQDSKRLTKECDREALYRDIVSSVDVAYAIAVVDAEEIDRINILRATLRAMKMAAETLMTIHANHANAGVDVDVHVGTTKTMTSRTTQNEANDDEFPYHIISEASSKIQGSYVVCNHSTTAKTTRHPRKKKKKTMTTKTTKEARTSNESESTPDLEDKDDCYYHDDDYYALIDGNRLPDAMPCQAETIVKGDSREYIIGAASILAKVTRDRLMNEYDLLYPRYNLRQNKGYPTAAHRDTVMHHGASPIHRRSFAPLKHMTFDDNGNIVIEPEDDQR